MLDRRGFTLTLTLSLPMTVAHKCSSLLLMWSPFHITPFKINMSLEDDPGENNFKLKRACVIHKLVCQLVNWSPKTHKQYRTIPSTCSWLFLYTVVSTNIFGGSLQKLPFTEGKEYTKCVT